MLRLQGVAQQLGLFRLLTPPQNTSLLTGAALSATTATRATAPGAPLALVVAAAGGMMRAFNTAGTAGSSCSHSSRHFAPFSHSARTHPQSINTQGRRCSTMVLVSASSATAAPTAAAPRPRQPLFAASSISSSIYSSSRLLAAPVRAHSSSASSSNGSSGSKGGNNSSSSSSSSLSSVGSSSQQGSVASTVLETQQPSHSSSQHQQGYGFIPPPPSERLAIWTDQVWGGSANVPVNRKMFCNRSLNMKQIKAIGFDMDYTLAQYKPDTFELLAHRQTIDKLVTAFGYPPELYDFQFDHRYMMRGLIIDKSRGNVVKVDRHKYVKVAYHGFKQLSSDERKTVYNQSAVRDDFEEPNYAMIDTLFSLAEAYLFMQLVELVDANPQKLPKFSGYAAMYRDVRAAVDLCHRDGSLKRHVAADPGKYIHDDPHLVPMLQMYAKSGRKLFLATNSLWDYTNVVMNYLINKRVGKKKNDEWLSFFDVVLVGCGKPGFFNERRPLFAVNTRDGSLMNTDNGAPTLPIDEDDLPADQDGSTVSELLGSDGKTAVFQGGNYVDLHKMLGVKSGTEVMYVGDHIYGDILRSKKSLGWRTMLVVPELENELAVNSRSQATHYELRMLRNARADVDSQLQRLEWAVRHGEVAAEAMSQTQAQLALLRAEREAIKERYSRLLRAHHEAFHPIWGQLLKTGYQNSRYGHQIDRFACLFTSHVSNMAFYSPDTAYSGKSDQMSHEDQLAMECPVCEE